MRCAFVERVGVAAVFLQGQQAELSLVLARAGDYQPGTSIRIEIVIKHIPGGAREDILLHVGEIVPRCRCLVPVSTNDGNRHRPRHRAASMTVIDRYVVDLRQRFARVEKIDGTVVYREVPVDPTPANLGAVVEKRIEESQIVRSSRLDDDSVRIRKVHVDEANASRCLLRHRYFVDRN